MSKETAEVLAEAIASHLKDVRGEEHRGELVVGWVVIAVSALPETNDANGYMWFAPEGQMYHSSLELNKWLTNRFLANEMQGGNE